MYHESRLDFEPIGLFQAQCSTEDHRPCVRHDPKSLKSWDDGFGMLERWVS